MQLRSRKGENRTGLLRHFVRRLFHALHALLEARQDRLVPLEGLVELGHRRQAGERQEFFTVGARELRVGGEVAERLQLLARRLGPDGVEDVLALVAEARDHLADALQDPLETCLVDVMELAGGGGGGAVVSDYYIS